MLANEVLYSKFTAGLESGLLRKTPKGPPSPIVDTITLGHEVAFRLELFMALSKRNFQHSPDLASADELIRKFKKLLPLVREDRRKHGQIAHDKRMVKLKKDAPEGTTSTQDNGPSEEISDDIF